VNTTTETTEYVENGNPGEKYLVVTRFSIRKKKGKPYLTLEIPLQDFQEPEGNTVRFTPMTFNIPREETAIQAAFCSIRRSESGVYDCVNLTPCPNGLGCHRCINVINPDRMICHCGGPLVDV
jgi:hypothetical protein